MTGDPPRRATLAALALLLGLAACADEILRPVPPGLAPPAATDAAAAPGADAPVAEAARLMTSVPAGLRAVALRVGVANPSEELLSPKGQGVVTLRDEADRRVRHLVFSDGALGVYALPPGVYRIERIAGFDCGPLYLTVAPGEVPLAVGSLSLDLSGEGVALLSGALPTPADLESIAGLIEADPAAISAEPLERRRSIRCEWDRRAVWRPDIDPVHPPLTPAQIAGSALVFAFLVGITAGAAATGTIVFTSGAAGGSLIASF